MNLKKTTLLTAFGLALFTAFAGNPKIETARVDLKLKLQPATGMISGTIEYSFPQDTIILLASDFKIESVIADGKIVFCEKTKPADLQFSTAYLLPFRPGHLVISYSGTIKAENFPNSISNQNRLNAEMLELTDLIDWYPKLKIGRAIPFSLKIDISSDFSLVTNGVQTSETFSGEQKQYSFESVKPVYGISLLGSKGMKKSVVAAPGYTIEIYYTKLPEDYIGKMIKKLSKTVEFYQNLYNSEGSNNLIKIIYSPRSAGGYARGSVIVVSEKFAFEQLNNSWGFARDFQLNSHEIAHLWSKANWEDYWINEGLAEFSAFLACEKFIGTEFATLLLDEYNVAIENSATQLSILETTGDSWESHINRYYKPTVLLNTLRQKYGEEKMTEFIALLNVAFVQNQGGTTVIFLNVLEEVLGKDAFDFFQMGLNRKNWNKSNGEANAAYDADFEGTWSGGLTQFGNTTKFVLHLKKADNKLVPVLDSPDQGAFGIPVSALKIEGDNIVCVVGVASATFLGKLDRNAKIIRGNWNQRGTEYPLELRKE
ncbi:MAG: M1 family aminopeptidase [Draconibacterium sp.]